MSTHNRFPLCGYPLVPGAVKSTWVHTVCSCLSVQMFKANTVDSRYLEFQGTV